MCPEVSFQGGGTRVVFAADEAQVRFVIIDVRLQVHYLVVSIRRFRVILTILIRILLLFHSVNSNVLHLAEQCAFSFAKIDSLFAVDAIHISEIVLLDGYVLAQLRHQFVL